MGGGYLLIILVLLVVTNSITYGVSQYTSDSVSYTRDGETKSVKEALDDLIVKVDKKSGNFNITLAEQPIVNGKTVSATTYKNLVNTVIDKMVTAMGSTATMAELTALKSATLTWTSENSTIATVNGTNVTGKSVGKTKIIGIDSTGKKVTVPVNVIAGEYLAQKAKVGDYVAYDAGNWNVATNIPWSHGQFGGNGTGNKGNSVTCESRFGSPNLKGWRVLKIDSGQVYLVHAGQPECYYHVFESTTTAYGAASKKALDDHAQSVYVNQYAQSAHVMTKDEVEAITNTSDTLRKTGTYYYLATAASQYLYYVSDDGSFDYTGSNHSWGFRPVVVLKSTVLTTGEGQDMFGNKAWIIA